MKMEDRLNFDPVSWGSKEEPLKAGDTLIGEVVEVSVGSSTFGVYPIIGVLDDEGHAWAWHAFQTVAKNELERQRPVAGDRIGVRYLGKSSEDDAQAYGRWRIVVERGASNGDPGAEAWAELQAPPFEADDEAIPHTADMA